MKGIGIKIFGTVIAMSITALLVFASFFSGGLAANGSDTVTGNNVQYSSVAVSEDKEGEALVYKEIPASSKPDASGVSYAYFGRLASLFYLPEEDFVANDQNIVRQNKYDITISSLKGIFSWYDPFVNYTVTDTKGNYKISQITNGSIYVGSESDGTISLYSIDLVADVTFMNNGQDMSKIIIFPGMYIRFNPKMNVALKDADLFRIMLALNQGDGSGSTGIEFVDPKVQSGENQSTFFMYRLPRETRELFRMLHTSFGERVRAVNLLEEYSASNYTVQDAKSQVVNPSKKLFYLLGELKGIFSQAVNADMSSEEFGNEVSRIYEASQNFSNNPNMENVVRDVIEQFLIDGRFALFLDVKNGQYQAIYNRAANILGIAPITGKGKLFQSLSNIFSKNLLRLTTDTTGFADTYNVVGTELKNTLSVGEIDTNDYFDLSLYAFLMFEKISDGKILNKSILEGATLPELYVTIFQATQKYAAGISNEDLANTAQKSLLMYFYKPMMELFVRSLYATYTYVEDGKIFLSTQYVIREDPQFSASMEANLKNIYNVLNSIRLSKIQDRDKTMSAYVSLENNIVSLQGFIGLIQKGNYKNYILNPYLANADTGLPSVKNGVIQQLDSLVTSTPPANNTPVADSDAQRIQVTNILKRTLNISTLKPDLLVLTQNGYALELDFTDYNIYFVYNTSTQMMNSITIHAKKYSNIRVVENLSLGTFPAFMSSVPLYLNRIDALSGDASIKTDDPILLFPSRNQMQVSGKFYPMIQ